MILVKLLIIIFIIMIGFSHDGIIQDINSEEIKNFGYLQTSLTPNENYESSMYIDVVHEIKDVNLFMQFNQYSLDQITDFKGMTTSDISDDLVIYYRNNLYGTEAYVLYESKGLIIDYTEYIYQTSRDDTTWQQKELIETNHKQYSIYEHQECKPIQREDEYAYESFGHCRVNLYDLTLFKEKNVIHYMYDETNGQEVKQIHVIKINGFEMQYTAKLNHLSIEEAEFKRFDGSLLFYYYFGYEVSGLKDEIYEETFF
jgi:hypothetical protein